jgi:rod shape-determining protein MreB
MAERTKVAIGSAYPLPEEQTITVRGRNLITGLPDAVEVSSVEIREALAGPVETVVEAIRSALDETPPELVADLMELGIALAGGGALLQGAAGGLSEGFDEGLQRGGSVTCVVRGGAAWSRTWTRYRKVLAT